MTAADVAAHQVKHFPKPEAAPSTADTRAEKELQADIVRLLDQRGIFFVRSRMDKKTSTRVGVFDFTIFMPNRRFLAVEAKVKGGRVSGAQEKLFAEFWKKTGEPVFIVWSLEEFRDLLNRMTPFTP